MTGLADYEVGGLDVVHAKLKEAREVTSADLVQADMRALPFGEEAFDGVFASMSLFHLRRGEMDDVLKNLRFVLAEDGGLYATLKASEGEELTDWQGGERFFTYYRPGEIAGRLTRAGFHLAHQHVEPSETTAGQDILVQVARAGRRRVREIGRKAPGRRHFPGAKGSPTLRGCCPCPATDAPGAARKAAPGRHRGRMGGSESFSSPEREPLMRLTDQPFLFDGPAVARLLRIADEADEHSPTCSEKIAIEEGKMSPDEVGLALHIVKDAGLYVIPNAAEARGDDYVVYARGTDGSIHFGGDDFVEAIPTHDKVLQLLGETHDLLIEFGEEQFEVDAVPRDGGDGAGE